MEENQPLPHCSRRTLSKPPLLPEATPGQQKRSRLTESSTLETSGSSYDLPESPILVCTTILVTPTITGLSATEVEPLQLPEDNESELSETITEVVQQEVDPQLEVVKEIHPEPIVILPKHLDPKVEQP